jgi:hypothetical protein
MRLLTLAVALSMAALGAGCDRDAGNEASTQASSKAPTTASGGATGTGTATGPKAERIEQPSAPPQTTQSGKDEKPDPGDANDHSNPQHDARNKKDGD